MPTKPILVTQSFLPPLEEVTELLKGVWDRVYLTNNGPLLLELERKLAERNYGAETIACLNGTIAIELALQALGVSGGEVITTPFTFPATSTSIVKSGARPVFVDVDPATWNIDPNEVEKAITAETKAILGVHVFSRPCDVVRLEEIARRHNVKLIFDAAHANFVQASGRSIFAWGDASTTSFHATKLFHTVEGGACFSPNASTREKLRQLRFFGYDSEKNLTDVGTNAKMTEVSAAVGLANLKYLDEVLATRRRLYELYLAELSNESDLAFQQYDSNEYNYSYFPVVFKDESQLSRVETALKENEIFPRRYFWPPLNDMSAFETAAKVGDLRVARSVSDRILCLPLYPKLSEENVETISRIVRQSQK